MVISKPDTQFITWETRSRKRQRVPHLPVYPAGGGSQDTLDSPPPFIVRKVPAWAPSIPREPHIAASAPPVLTQGNAGHVIPPFVTNVQQSRKQLSAPNIGWASEAAIPPTEGYSKPESSFQIRTTSAWRQQLSPDMSPFVAPTAPEAVVYAATVPEGFRQRKQTRYVRRVVPDLDRYLESPTPAVFPSFVPPPTYVRKFAYNLQTVPQLDERPATPAPTGFPFPSWLPPVASRASFAIREQRIRELNFFPPQTPKFIENTLWEPFVTLHQRSRKLQVWKLPPSVPGPPPPPTAPEAAFVRILKANKISRSGLMIEPPDPVSSPLTSLLPALVQQKALFNNFVRSLIVNTRHDVYPATPPVPEQPMTASLSPSYRRLSDAPRKALRPRVHNEYPPPGALTPTSRNIAPGFTVTKLPGWRGQTSPDAFMGALNPTIPPDPTKPPPTAFERWGHNYRAQRTGIFLTAGGAVAARVVTPGEAFIVKPRDPRRQTKRSVLRPQPAFDYPETPPPPPPEFVATQKPDVIRRHQKRAFIEIQEHNEYPATPPTPPQPMSASQLRTVNRRHGKRQLVEPYNVLPTVVAGQVIGTLALEADVYILGLMRKSVTIRQTEAESVSIKQVEAETALIKQLHAEDVKL